MTKYTVDWMGTVALAVCRDGEQWFTFSLEEGQIIPTEFGVGDELHIVNHPDPTAMFVPEVNKGYYEITHVASGKVLRTMHRADQYKVE